MKKLLIISCLIFTSNSFACSDGSNDMYPMLKFPNDKTFTFSEKAIETLRNTKKSIKISIKIDDNSNKNRSCLSTTGDIDFKYELYVDEKIFINYWLLNFFK